jgi:hypothetical protein
MKAYLKSLALPLLAAAYPLIFLYGHNAGNLQLGVLKMPLGYSWLIVTLVHGLFFLFQRRPVIAGLSATVFVLFYFSYGYFYNQLVLFDQFPVYHFTLLPLVLVMVIYAGYFLTFIKPDVALKIHNITLLVFLFLVTLNVGITLPVEVQKNQPKKTALIPQTGQVAASQQKHPDIYYIIFDEYAGFDVMRSYFHDNDVDQFEAFLNQNHFFIVSNSRTPTINTQTEMASRLNLKQYNDKTDTQLTHQALVNNKVFQVVKSYGYTTAVLNMAYSDIPADFNLAYDPQQVSGMASDEFREMFLSYSMLDAFSRYLNKDNAAEIKQRDLILYTLEQTADLSEVKSPKFVYTHVLFPHQPFIFDENGNLLPPQDGYDWHFYLGQYKYATKLAMQLISSLLAGADPANPPVIIFQSDEGARNLARRTKDGVILDGYLENYPIEYAYHNINALYLPGYDTSQLSNNLPTIQTLPIVLNYYLNAGISVEPGTP